jgi:hypothetical protein
LVLSSRNQPNTSEQQRGRTGTGLVHLTSTPQQAGGGEAMCCCGDGECRPLGWLLGLPFALLAVLVSFVGAIIWIIGCVRALASQPGFLLAPLFFLLSYGSIGAAIKVN